MEPEYKHKQLLEKWRGERPDYDSNAEFCGDGPSDWVKWNKQKPRILFLVKEPHGGYHPNVPNQKIKGNFGLNISRWKFAIKEIYKNSNAIPVIPNNQDLRSGSENNNDDIAIVEVKKNNEEKKISSLKEIMEYAKKDKYFLKEQIDLINPQIILCGYTIDAYGDYIYGDDNWEELYSINEPRKCRCYKHLNRLVIDFYHPSSRSGSTQLFELLCKLLKDGKVFEKFDWHQ